MEDKGTKLAFLIRNSRMTSGKPQKCTRLKPRFMVRSALCTILPEMKRHTFALPKKKMPVTMAHSTVEEIQGISGVDKST